MSAAHATLRNNTASLAADGIEESVSEPASVRHEIFADETNSASAALLAIVKKLTYRASRREALRLISTEMMPQASSSARAYHV